MGHGKGVHVEGSGDADSGRVRWFGCAVNRNVGARIENVVSSDSVKGRDADKGEADEDVGSQFDLLMHTLIEGLSRFT